MATNNHNIIEGFYWVWCAQKGAPTYKHYDVADAEREAKRLATANPGNTYIVIKPVSSFQSQAMNETRFEFPLTEDIPF